MKKKFTIRIERKELYVFDVEVEANDAAEAVRNVEKRWNDGEFEGEKDLYYLPVGCDDHVYCAEEKEV